MLVLAAIIPGAFGFIVEGLVARRIERAHPDIVAGFDRRRTPTGRQISRFVWTGEHRRLGDGRLSRLILWVRGARAGAAVLALAGILLIWSGR